MRAVYTILFGFLYLTIVEAQTPPAFERFLRSPQMKGASISFMLKDILNDSILFSYDADKEIIPASVMKLVTTATALEILEEQFKYETVIMYDGQIQDGTLYGNLHILGSGDPTLGSSESGRDNNKIIREWITAIKNAGIRAITGSVISDESIFDFEGVSMKWLREDLGNYYAPGSYGLNIFDNSYTLFLQTAAPNSRPEILKTEPEMPSLLFHNYLITSQSNSNNSYITGLPFMNDRYLFGVVPPNRNVLQLKGDIPEPSLFLAQYLTKQLEKENISVGKDPVNYRITLQNNGLINRISSPAKENNEHKIITRTCSPPMNELVRITNHASHNLYADVLLKTIGLRYHSDDEVLSSFEKGVSMLKQYWEAKGLDVSSVWMYDGSGLAAADKLTASFVCDLLSYMYTQSPVSGTFIESIPRAGVEGTVANILRGSRLQQITRLKSGSMSRVRSYAGYVMKENKAYTVAIFVNNFSCSQTQIRLDIERLFLSLLP